MALVNAKCTNCGGVLEVDNSKEAFICTHCGSPFIVEKAINNYTTVNNTTNQTTVTHNYNINADTVYVTPDKEFEIVSGILKKYVGASTVVNIPETVVGIEARAFQKQIGLTEVSIPYGVKFIGESAFLGCENLEKVIIPDSVAEIGKFAFFKCRKLKKVNIPNGIKTIAESTFDYTGLESVEISESVDFIDENAFYDCNDLVRVKLPEKDMTIIAKHAFSGCNIEELRLPDRIYSIKNGAFSRCSSLKNITNLNGISEIGDFVVNGTALDQNQIEFWEKRYNSFKTNNGFLYKIAQLKAEYRILEKGKILLKYDGMAEEIVIDADAIEAEAFMGNEHIKSVKLLRRVAYIGKKAFSGCKNLKEITTCITSINDYPLYKCTIDAEAFKDCCCLENLDFKDLRYISKISDEVFANCPNIKKITGLTNQIIFGRNIFKGSHPEKLKMRLKDFYSGITKECPFCGGKLSLFKKCKNCGNSFVN